jgi:hypothetical protein
MYFSRFHLNKINQILSDINNDTIHTDTLEDINNCYICNANTNLYRTRIGKFVCENGNECDNRACENKLKNMIRSFVNDAYQKGKIDGIKETQHNNN